MAVNNNVTLDFSPQAEMPRVERVIKECPTCKKKFSSLLCQNKVYCCKKCAVVGKTLLQTGKNHVEHITKICPRCKKEFSIRIGESQIYCSRECQRSPRETINCLFCNTPFEKMISENRKYCSKKCTNIDKTGKKCPTPYVVRRITPHGNIGKSRPSRFKGIPYEERYGKEKAARIRKAQTGRIVSEEQKEELRERTKKLWKNPDYVEKQKKAREITPNKPEKKLGQLLEDLFPREYKFVGDWTVAIDGKSPDFININGQKKIVELFGDYWHRGQNPQDRVDAFKPFGYDTLVIWEHELENREPLENKLRKFHRSVHVY